MSFRSHRKWYIIRHLENWHASIPISTSFAGAFLCASQPSRCTSADFTLSAFGQDREQYERVRGVSGPGSDLDLSVFLLTELSPRRAHRLGVAKRERKHDYSAIERQF